MKNKLLLGLVFLAFATTANGQIVRWLIPPVYDNIQMAEGENLVITDSLKYKIIWSQSGYRLSMTKDHISPFAEGYAVTTDGETDKITGFYDKSGKFTDLSGCRVSYNMPYFSDQHLLVNRANGFRFVDTAGNIDAAEYVYAFPFFNGYATCQAYANPLKRKDPYNLLLSKDNEQIVFSYGGKPFDKYDIQFISSVNDENIGIVIAKHKLYYFNGETRALSPVFASENETNIKNQAKLEDELLQCIKKESDSLFVLSAKCGKNDRIHIKINRLKIPLSITLADGEHIYKKRSAPARTFTSPLKTIKYEDKIGINWEEQEILPPQLDDILLCFDDKAFIRLYEYYGMLKVLKDEEFKITINKGNPIDFRHQKYETTIRLDLPKFISSYKTRIVIDPKSGCEVDLPSGVKRDTEFGNNIQYDCVLNIPQSLPDEMYGDSRNEITYPTQIVYNGLWSPVIPFKVKAWHYKYFNVDINDAETSISQGTLSFTFNINAERNPGEAVYPTSVFIQTDSLKCELEKLSETRYKCKVFSLVQGENNIVVQILEQGCPPASFPFEVTYTKPSARTSKTAAVKEDVVIKKKTKKTSITPTPHLDI